MAVSPPADRRFRRPPVRPAAPPRGTRLRVAVLAAGAILLAGGLHALGGALRAAEALAIREVAVRGDRWLARGELLALLDDLHGANMFAVDLEHWRERLLGSPWVVDVSLRRTLPGTITVVLSERQPIAIARIGGALYLMDREATLVDRFGPRYAALDLPIVDGLATRPAGDAVALDDRRVSLAVRLLSALARRPDLAARISQIDVTDPRDAALLLRDDTARLRIGHEHFADRLQTYLEIAGVLHEQVADIDYVDLRFDERVFLMPRAPRQPAGAGGAATGGRAAVRGGRG